MYALEFRIWTNQGILFFNSKTKRKTGISETELGIEKNIGFGY